MRDYKISVLALAASLFMPLGSIAQAQDEITGTAGNYLVSQQAQKDQDWHTSHIYLDKVLDADKDNSELLKRGMILAVGTGQMDRAVSYSRDILVVEPDNKIAQVILALSAFEKGDNAASRDYLVQMGDGDIAAFIRPIMEGWMLAQSGKFKSQKIFKQTTLHAYHAGLMAIYLGEKKEAVDLAKAITVYKNISAEEAVRAADLFAAAGAKEEALTLYRGLYMQNNRDKHVSRMINALELGGQDLKPHLLPLQIKDAKQGVAQIIYDMALMLYGEQSTSSARIFAYMALELDPGMTRAYLLLADTMAQAGRFDEAIKHLSNVPNTHESYMDAQRHAAELLADAGRMDEARERLNRLFVDHNDVESLIRIGDLYRRQEDYKNALDAYNQAAGEIGERIPEEYWYLLYARGMAYEREGRWNKAERDLKAALVYRPNHAYLLNYLGYGWADQGLNLDRSLELVKRAVSLQPNDGFIIDSLGWVQYMMGSYDDAVVTLEKAVEMLPYDTTVNDHLGDAYWQLGRKLEARFQWERARNFAEDEDVKVKLKAKIAGGLEALEFVKQAKSQ